MAKDIEQFLREAAARRQRNQPQPNRPAPPSTQQSAPQRPSQPSEEPLVVEPEVIEPQVVDQSGDPYRIDEEDQTPYAIDTSNIHQADDGYQHLVDSGNENYDQLGGLDNAGEKSRSHSEILEMLRNPKTLRTAVIVKEVLDRPVHRW